MTNEDEKIVADYMNWPEDEILQTVLPFYGWLEMPLPLPLDYHIDRYLCCFTGLLDTNTAFLQRFFYGYRFVCIRIN